MGTRAELMKGRTWHERKHKVKYPVWVEPKIDEIRCHVKLIDLWPTPGKTVEFLSYAGKPLANMHGFVRPFCEAMQDQGITEIDCGVEVNGNFNDSYRWVRSTKRIPRDLALAPVKFHVYGLPEYSELLPEALQDVVEALHAKGVSATMPGGYLCHTPEEVEAVYGLYRAAGYEGAMVKQPNLPYSRGKRTDAWLKMKPEDDADGIITALVEAVCGKDQPELGLRVGDKLGRIGSVLVQCEDGSTAQPHGIPHGLGKDMYLHPEKYLNEWCEFKFMERDRQGGYRHPTFHRIREAKK